MIEDMNLPEPGGPQPLPQSFLKQYLRDRFILRTETATNNISTDLRQRQGGGQSSQLRQRLNAIDRYRNVQQAERSAATRSWSS